MAGKVSGSPRNAHYALRRDLFKITVQISANAGRNEIIGWQGERLKIKVKAPAVTFWIPRSCRSKIVATSPIEGAYLYQK